MTSLAPLSLASAIANTRSGAAYYWDSTGALATAAAGVSRVDYDLATLVPRGLLLEETRTNYLLNSTTLSTQSLTLGAVPHTLSFYGTGTVTLSGAYSGSLVGSAALGARSTLTFTPSAGSVTFTVTGSVLYAQLEAGAFATSWIFTSGTSVTRARDAATVNSAADWLATGAGSVFVEFMVPYTSPSDGVYRRVLQFDDGSVNNAILIGIFNGVAYAEITYSGQPLQASLTLGAVAANTAKKIAFGWASNNAAAVMSGGSIVADTACLIPPLTTARLGCSDNTAQDLSGYIRAVRYYPRRLSNNELTALVA